MHEWIAALILVDPGTESICGHTGHILLTGMDWGPALNGMFIIGHYLRVGFLRQDDAYSRV